MKLNILDKNNCLLGYVENNQVFNIQGTLIKDVSKNPNITIQEIRHILLNEKTLNYSN
jgi:hypothetical protein